MSSLIQGNYSQYVTNEMSKASQSNTSKNSEVEDNSIFTSSTSSNSFVDSVQSKLNSDSTSSGSNDMLDRANELLGKAEKESSDSKEGGGILSWKIWPWNWVKS